VVIGKTIDMQIASVSKSGTNLVVTWTAKLGGADVNPCNTDVTAGPVFVGATASATTGMVASNMSIVKAYAQGDDWVNAGTGTTPGQPTSVNLSTTNTVCASNVATSTVAYDTLNVSATKGVVALQGKPQVRFAPAAGTKFEVIQVRAKSPTREFMVADGALPAALRRPIVSTDKCLACHLGSLYQHGGNRVDNNDLCVTCHNPASNEKWYRSGVLGLTAAVAYDGKVGETIDMRTMVHAIHSAGETGRPLVYYRSNGVYFFGTKAALAAVANWPTSGGVTCKNSEGADVTYYKVAGSAATGRVPFAVAGTGLCDTTTGTVSTDGTWLVHNFIEVHYPRQLNDCSACHVAGWTPATVDGSKGVAVTVDPGTVVNSTATNANTVNGNQLDDVLMGPTTASCMTCHQSGDATTQFYLRLHAYDGGWSPSTFPNGRQTLLDAVP
jgi:hypothetical protein